MLSIQTNVNALVAEQNLNINSKFQSQTIQQLTSGYRINNAGDDAAGLAVANQLRDDTSELTQGVSNGNNAVAQLQIMDSGMSNISQILDRLKTLATQSASGTFTGNRSILNQEFQSDVQEIDRQAQSIGLDTGGTFAKSLSVYLGQGSGSQSLSNAQVGVDLSTSTVDSQSLGLKGMQAVVGAADLGATSATSVASILANQTNSNSGTVTSTQFLFSGPGFATNGNPLAVSVNLNGVGTVEDLVSNINSAIQSTANGSTAADAALKNAGIVASVHTDANGGEQLAFTSSTTAIQVQAGDQMANALMGNFSSGTTGATLSATVTGSAYDNAGTMAGGTQLNITLSGAGMASPVNIDRTYASDTSMATVVQNLQSDVAGSQALKDAGITVGTSNGQVVFTNSKGAQFQVDVAGDVKNQLGLGAFASSGTTSADYNSITAATAYSNAGNTGVNQQTTLEISVAGAPAISLGAVALDQGNATAASNTSGTLTPTTVVTGVPATAATYTAGAAIGTGYTPQDYSTTFGDITVQVGATSHDIHLTGNDQTFTQLKADLQSGIDGAFGAGQVQVGDDGHGKLGLTSLNPGTTHDITITAGTANSGANSALAALGFNGSDAPVAGKAGSGNSIVQFSVDGHQISFNLNTDTAATAATATGTTAVGTGFSTINYTTTTAATTSSYTAAGLASATGNDFNSTSGDINVTLNGVQQDITLTRTDHNIGDLESDLQTALDASGTGFGDGSALSSGIQVADDGHGHITLTATTSGAGHDISVAAGTNADASAILGFNAGNDTVVNGQDASTSAQAHNILVTLNGVTQNVQLTGVHAGNADTSFTELKQDLQQGLDTAFGDGSLHSSGVTVGDDTHGDITLTTIATGANQSISLAAGATNSGLGNIGFTAGPGTAGTDATTTSLASVANQINQAITTAQTSGVLEGTGSGATASVVGNTIQIVNSHAGADHSISGLTSGVGYLAWGSATLTNATSGVAYGYNRDVTSLMDAINQQIAGNSTLEKNGFQASLSGNNLLISANAGVNFRVNGGAASATAQVVGATDLTAGANFSLTPMTLNVKIDGSTYTANLNQNYTSASQLLNAINTQFGANYASMTSLNGKNYLAFTSPTANSTSGSVQVLSTGTANAALGLTDNTAHYGANEVDTGFGVSNSSSTGNLAVTAASSSLNVSDAAGTAQTGGLSFVNMSAGTQALTVTATNSGGAMQATTITLSASNGTGSDIDSAVNYINQQLQQTNNPTLKSIVAVKQNVSGVEEINFMSPGTAFQVSVGSTSDSTGVNAGTGENVSGTITGTSSTIGIDTQDGATAAIAALGAAVAKLGSAQASVGKGENQLNYAINLAQSQITNFSAAESQIRDADVAAEAANLSKAQILQQASIAAMAQANTAPQAVLKLLQG